VEAHRAARDIVLTDDRLRVVGFGRSGERRPDVQKVLHYPWAVDSGWQGVARATTGNLHAFAVLHDGAVCEVGAKSALALPPRISVRAESSGRVGAALGQAAFGGGAGWTLGGASPATGPAPQGARAYGSWSGADKNTGFVTFGPFSGDVGEVMIGLVTGPDTTAQSIAIKDAKTFEVLAASQPLKTDKWTWMRLTLPPSAKGRAVTIEAVDYGSGWGQWMGVTEPRAVLPAAR
jgi:hypothetical protein